MKDRSSIAESGSGETLSDSVDPVLEKTIWRKLDFYILPVVAMFYFLSFLVRVGRCFLFRMNSDGRCDYQDRSNIGNARVAGLQQDLKMTNYQYSIALTITYIPYIAAELPSNLLLKV